MGPIQPETSPFQTIKNRLKDKYQGLFSNRKVRVLDDPSLVPFEPLKRPDGAVPVTRRHIQPSKPEPQNLTQKQQKQETNVPPRAKKTPQTTKAAQPGQLQQQLLTECRNLLQQPGSVSSSPIQRLLAELQKNIIRGQWEAVLEMIDMNLHFAGISDFDRFQAEIIQALETVSTPPPETVNRNPAVSDINSQKKALQTPDDLNSRELNLERQSLKSFQGGQVNLVIGDITNMASILGHPVEAIACPYSGATMKGNRLFRRLAAIEPDLIKPGVPQALNQYPGGQSVISGGGRLARLGYRKLVLGILPMPNAANPRETFVNAYLSAIQGAANQDAASIALPVFTANMGLTPETSVAIAREAIEKYLAGQKSPGKPRIYLVFPNTAEGREQYTKHLAINSQPAKSNHPPAGKKTKTQAFHSSVLGEKQFQHLMEQVLPPKGHLSVARRMHWLQREHTFLLNKLRKGKVPEKRLHALDTYIGAAYDRLHNLPDLSREEFLAAALYLDRLDDQLTPYLGA
ncbi:MAG: hypothetical protein ACR2PT_18035 [Endozoicomonas sp.]